MGLPRGSKADVQLVYKVSHCISNNEESDCPVASCYWNTYWNVCQHPYVGYSSPSTSDCPEMTCNCEEGHDFCRGNGPSDWLHNLLVSNKLCFFNLSRLSRKFHPRGNHRWKRMCPQLRL
eukprot:UN14461